MKKALLLFNLGANSSETEEMHARNCELALSQMFHGTQWLVRTGKEDGEMRMHMLGMKPEGDGTHGGENRYSKAQWGSYYNRWLKDIHTGDTDGDTYSALICGDTEGGLGNANANITDKVWTENRMTYRDAEGHRRVFIMQSNGSLKMAFHYSKISGAGRTGTCGRLV